MPEDIESVAMPAMRSSAQLADFLNRPAAAQPAAVQAGPEQPRATISNCPACKASLSGVELKLEKCLSCGKGFSASAGNISVSVGI